MLRRARTLGARMGQRRLDDFGFADEDELESGIGDEGAQRAGYAFRRTAVTTHYVDGDGRHVEERAGFDDPAARIILRFRLRPVFR